MSDQVHIFYFQRQDLLEAWKSFEEERGTEDAVQKVQAMLPTPKKVRKQIDEFNQEEGSCLLLKWARWFLILMYHSLGDGLPR